jgi:hypothetical protein
LKAGLYRVSITDLYQAIKHLELYHFFKLDRNNFYELSLPHFPELIARSQDKLLLIETCVEEVQRQASGYAGDALEEYSQR